jgi:hypothetical protein
MPMKDVTDLTPMLRTDHLESDPVPSSGMRRRRGWLAWISVVFLLWNGGLPHEVWHAHVRSSLAERLAHPLRELRAHLTNDGDVLRYFAYCNALLGRRHSGYYVRAAAEWQREDDAHLENVDPDAYPERDGPPLRPYQDFVVEYPPGFFLWTLPLALLTSDGDTYSLLFGVWMGLLLTAAIILCRRLAPPAERDRLPALAAAAALAIGFVVTHRYDAVVSLLLCLACSATVSRRPILGGTAFGLSVATKIVPVVVAPVIAIALIRAGRFRELRIQAASALLAGGAVVAGALALWGPGFLDVGRYHAQRPFQIESTWAGLLGLLRLVSADSLHYVHSHGSSNVEGRFVPFLAPLATPLLAAALVFVYARAWMQLGRTAGPRPLVAAVSAAMAVFMVFGKVFSPQYLVWLIPLGLVASRERTRTLLLVVLGLTQLLFPYLHSWLGTLSSAAFALLLLRNGTLLYWAYLVQREAET